MKKIFTASVLIISSIFLNGQVLNKKSEPFNSVSDKIFSYSPNSIKIEGYLGGKINLVIGQRIKAQDVDHLVEPFRYKNETHLWQSEFWSKEDKVILRMDLKGRLVILNGQQAIVRGPVVLARNTRCGSRKH